MKPSSIKAVASVSAWVFGIATSVLFVALWGRAVVVDTDELGQSLQPMSESSQVRGLFTDWIGQELVDVGVGEEVAKSAAQEAFMVPEVSDAMDGFVVGVVVAAASPEDAAGVVDVAEILQPTVPAVTVSLASSGVPVDEAQVGEVVAGLDPLVIREPGEAALVGPRSPLATHLGTAVLISSLALVTFGGLYVLAGADRLRRIKTLLTRFGLTGLSFAVMLKLGSWVLDPGGGRAPLSDSLSLVADSKWAIPGALGGIGVVAALFVWLIRSSVRQAEGSPQTHVTPIRRAG